MPNLPFDAETARKLRDKKLIDDATFKRFGFDLPPEGPEPAPGGYQSPHDYASLIASPAEDGEGMPPMGPEPAQPAPSAAPEPMWETPPLDTSRQLPERMPTPAPEAPRTSGGASGSWDEPVAATSSTGPQQVGVGAPDQMAGGGMLAGFDLATEGLIKEAAAGKAQAAYESAFIDEQARLSNERIAKMELEQAEAQKRMDEAQATYQKAVDEMAGMKVDKNRLWANMGTGNKITAGIAMFLGAFGTSDSNRAVKVINDAIERDIREQESNIAIKGKDVANRRGILSDMLSRFSTERQAKLATHAAYLQNAEFELHKYAAKFKGTIAEAKAMQAAGELEMKRNKLLYDMAKDAAEMRQKGMLSHRDLFVPGYGFALTPDDAKEAKNLIGVADNIKKNIDDMVNLRESQGGFEVLNRGAVSRGQIISVDTLLQIKELAKLGVLNGPDLDLIKKMIPEDPLEFSLTGTTAKNLGTVKDLIQRRLDTFLRARGLQGPSKDEVHGFKESN